MTATNVPDDPRSEALASDSDSTTDQASDQPTAKSESTPATGLRERVRNIKIGSQRDAKAAAETSSEAAVEQPQPAPPAVDEPDVSPPTEAAEDVRKFPPPRVEHISEELQQEIDEALGGASVDDLLAGEITGTQESAEPEVEQRYRASVVKVHREDVFFTLPGGYEGFASLRQFEQPPEPGDALDVVVVRHNAEHGLYELTIPGAAVSVGDWSDLEEGVVVEARITGHNAGGLECEVNNIRGFIPMSQIALFRVDELDPFVDEKMSCVVTEANAEKRNLVLSRRAVLERERAAAKEQLMQTLEVGQQREGIVRKLMDFGAFVDLGGVDGLIHISQLSWDRVNHPSEVLEEGQKVTVRIEKIDSASGRIGLSYRDLADHPWQDAEQKFAVGSVTTGTVSKIMDFGAFVRLAAGVEGLVHISELAHHRVAKVATVVSEGDTVEVKILSVDPEAQRMSLSMKAVQQAPQPKAAAQDKEPDEPPREKATKQHQGPLKGGTNRSSGGDQFGLKW